MNSPDWLDSLPPPQYQPYRSLVDLLDEIDYLLEDLPDDPPMDERGAREATQGSNT